MPPFMRGGDMQGQSRKAIFVGALALKAEGSGGMAGGGIIWVKHAYVALDCDDGAF
ncbi:hypothetical protein [Thalassospira alkalitolerans]|uniref:hypothetical protein n=1 Tax=Thalassospira alkalitolerans TaxID=1293890 RepID=UPI003AA8E10B